MGFTEGQPQTRHLEGKGVQDWNSVGKMPLSIGFGFFRMPPMASSSTKKHANQCSFGDVFLSTIGSKNLVHGLAIVRFSACKPKKVFSVVASRNLGTGPHTPDKICLSLRLMELDGGRLTAVPMRWVSNAACRDWIDHRYLPKVLSPKMSIRPEAILIARRLVDSG